MQQHADAAPPSPFDESRRLTGPNRHFRVPCAVLDARADLVSAATLEAWELEVRMAASRLGWPVPAFDVRRRSVTTLAFTAPVDQLFAATEVNEYAWQRACDEAAGLHAPGHPPPFDADIAAHCLTALSRDEARPDLIELLLAADLGRVPFMLDDDTLTLGEGEGARGWPLAALPVPDAVPWKLLHGVPKVLVTGSNGKTTTVRLVAAMARAHGWRCGHSCTDGLFLEGARLAAGDYSGPVGARTLLRSAGLQAAVLESARGGLLRRGLAVRDAEVAVVTNVSADHFGEYGIDSLEDLADAKLVVAAGVRDGGRVVVNADDAVLAGRDLPPHVQRACFALDDAHPLLRATRAEGGATCGVADGVLWLSHGDAREALGPVDAMPLVFGGLAPYNLSNLAAAVLAADALGIAAATIAATCARFGADPADNPGRLQRWAFGDVTVLLDYAHNPDGLAGFLGVAQGLRRDGRLGLVLGQAGNREDDDVRALARTAVRFAPARVVLKDVDGYLRGRIPGEVPRILEAELLSAGLSPAMLDTHLREAEAARALLAWAREGDVLALPIHALSARSTVVALLDAMAAAGWRAGSPLPGGDAVSPAVLPKPSTPASMPREGTA